MPTSGLLLLPDRRVSLEGGAAVETSEKGQVIRWSFHAFQEHASNLLLVDDEDDDGDDDSSGSDDGDNDDVDDDGDICSQAGDNNDGRCGWSSLDANDGDDDDDDVLNLALDLVGLFKEASYG